MSVAVSDPSSASFNAYVTLSEATAYFLDRLYTTAWDSSNDKNAVCIWASRVIDANMNWLGDPTNAFQTMAWPRTDMIDSNGADVPSDVIPTELKHAVYEEILLLLASDPTAVSSSGALKALKADTVELEYFAGTASTSTVARAVKKILNSFIYNSSIYVGRLVRG